MIGAGREQQERRGARAARGRRFRPVRASTPFHAQVGEGHDGPRARRPAGAARRLARGRDRRSPLDAGRAAGRRASAACRCWAASPGSAAAARRACSRTAAAPRRAPSASCSRACRVSAIVSQGARPIGPELVVTAAEGNLVIELAGRPALERVQQVVEDLPLTERLLLENGLLIGLVIDENRPEHGLGDFLVRGVLGADPDTGAIGDRRRPARRPDRAPARARRGVGLARAGRAARAAGARSPASAALLFACNGRGRNLFAAGRSRRRHGRAACSAATPSRAASARASWGRWAAARSCTATPPASRCGDAHRTVTTSSPPRASQSSVSRTASVSDAAGC